MKGNILVVAGCIFRQAPFLPVPKMRLVPMSFLTHSKPLLQGGTGETPSRGITLSAGAEQRSPSTYVIEYSSRVCNSTLLLFWYNHNECCNKHISVFFYHLWKPFFLSFFYLDQAKMYIDLVGRRETQHLGTINVIKR